MDRRIVCNPLSHLLALGVTIVAMGAFPVMARAASKQEAGKEPAPIERTVLMIGNSFSLSVMRYLPPAVASVPGCKLRIMSLYIPGCPLDRHAANIRASEDDPSKKQYSMTRSGFAENKGGRLSIQEALETEKWDVVTIQQASPKSWNPKTYEPATGEIIKTIRRLAPQAEIIFQHTWAYNAADGRLQPDSKWGFDQFGMHRRITEACNKVTAKYRIRKIPTGPAVEAARRKGLPDVVGSGKDTIHLNRRGDYLQACVWFESLFDRSPDEISFVPKTVEPEEAVILRRCAVEGRKSDFCDPPPPPRPSGVEGKGK